MKRIVTLAVVCLLLPSLSTAVSVEQDRMVVEEGGQFTWNVTFNYNVTEDRVAVITPEEIDEEDTYVEDSRKVTVTFEVDDTVESGVYSVGLKTNRSVISIGGSETPITETVFTSVSVGTVTDEELHELEEELNSTKNVLSYYINKLHNETAGLNETLSSLEDRVTRILENREERLSELEEKLKRLKSNVTTLRKEQSTDTPTGKILETGSTIGGILILAFLGLYVIYRRREGEDGGETLQYER
ncbi:MAG: hypothetical protein ABEJ72_08360 [Candidatus Aenigmatarchaeota archaeon]